MSDQMSGRSWAGYGEGVKRESLPPLRLHCRRLNKLVRHCLPMNPRRRIDHPVCWHDLPENVLTRLRELRGLGVVAMTIHPVHTTFAKKKDGLGRAGSEGQNNCIAHLTEPRTPRKADTWPQHKITQAAVAIGMSEAEIVGVLGAMGVRS
jgi:hypothetical protein